MKRSHSTIAGLLSIAAMNPLLAADKIRIGFLSTQSGGPTIAVSTELRQGFELALKQLGGKFGNLPVEMVYADDGNNPGTGKLAYDRLVKRDKVDLITGTVTTPVIFAVAPLAAQDQTIFINPNVSDRSLGGEKCTPYYFSTGSHMDGVNETLGKFVKTQGKKKVFVLGGNWQAGREAIAAFKRGYSDPVIGESFYGMQTLDFSPEIAKIRAAEPDAVYAFTFGPLSVNFMKQYTQAGLKHIPLYGPGPLADEGNIPATGEAALDVTTSAHWNDDLPNEVNKKFVAAYQAEYKKDPTTFSEQGYTTAMVLDAALKTTGGKIDDKPAFRKAMLGVKLETPRGPFRINVDGSPVENIYLRKVGKNAKGEITNLTQRPIGMNVEVASARDCKL